MGKPWSESAEDWNVKALPAALQQWANATRAYGVSSTGTFDSEAASWKTRSLVATADKAFVAADQKTGSHSWWDAVNYAGVENVDVGPQIASVMEILQDRLEYIMDGGFDGFEYEFDANASLDHSDVTWSGEAAYEVTAGVPSASAASVDATFTVAGEKTYTWASDATLPNFEASDLSWADAELLTTLREFALEMIDDGEVDSIVEKYRASLEYDYEQRSHRAAAQLFFVGAADTSPAALALRRRGEEIERQVAAFRAELIRSMYPDSNSIVGALGLLISDASRKDTVALENQRLIVQIKLQDAARIIEARIAEAQMETSIEIAEARETTQANISTAENNFRKHQQEFITAAQLFGVTLEAAIKLGVVNQSAKLDILKTLLALDSAAIELHYKHIDLIIQLRREVQVNRMKAAMWRMEISEALINAATVPLGVPMMPPDPSKFETKLAGALSTAGQMAISGGMVGGPIGGAIGAGLGLLTALF